MSSALISPRSGIGSQSLFNSSLTSDGISSSQNPPPPTSSHITSNLDERSEESPSHLLRSPTSRMEPPPSRTTSDSLSRLPLPHPPPTAMLGTSSRQLPKLLPLLRPTTDMDHGFPSSASQQSSNTLSATPESSAGMSVDVSHDRGAASNKRKDAVEDELVPHKKQKLNTLQSAGTLMEASSAVTLLDSSQSEESDGRKSGSKITTGNQNSTKRRQAENASPRKRNRPSKKPKKGESAKERISQDIWMRILEYTPPQFLSKMRLVSREFKEIVDKFDSIYVNCRKENYGYDMPSPPEDLTERQYSNLLGGKGCMEPGCDDKNSSKTHWSWLKRWCLRCWKKKIIREDRIIKFHSGNLSRQTVMDLLECIPVGMHDSFEKPHDYIQDPDARTRVISRMYHCYVKEDYLKIKAEYEDLDPGPYEENPDLTPEEQAAARADHQKLLDTLDARRAEFIATRQEKAAEHMEKVMKIEELVRAKRESVKDPNAANRQARRELFTRRAQEDLPHIDVAFVQKTDAFKAATRIFRDPGSERGWKALKPKIEAEWEKARGKDREANSRPPKENETREGNSSGDSIPGPRAAPPGGSTEALQGGIGNSTNLAPLDRGQIGNRPNNMAVRPPYNEIWYRGHVPRGALPPGGRTTVRYGFAPALANLPSGVGIAVMSHPDQGVQSFPLPPLGAGSTFGQPHGPSNPGYHQGLSNYGNHFNIPHSSASLNTYFNASHSSLPAPSHVPARSLHPSSARPQFPSAVPRPSYTIPPPPQMRPSELRPPHEYRSLSNQLRGGVGRAFSGGERDMMSSTTRASGHHLHDSYMGSHGSSSSSGR